jgi:2-aminoadipate transaminase
MVDAIKEHFPPEVRYTKPEGGMFLWAALPGGLTATGLFERAIQQKVAFVPGDPFYVKRTGVNTLRLNYSSLDEETIRIGIGRLGEVLKEMLAEVSAKK